MIPNSHSRRFDPRWLSRPLKMDWEALMEALDADLDFTAIESTNEPDLRTFDEALEQIVSEERRVCTLCGGDLVPRESRRDPRSTRPQSRHNS
jgi:hypothetical protein